ncbi:hypothetical protein KR222_006809, partial [Zaprionus bogoriensis]
LILINAMNSAKYILLAFLWQYFCEGNPAENSYVYSMEGLKYLLRLEAALIKNMEDYLNELKEKHTLMQHALADLRAEQQKICSNPEAYFLNPLNRLKLIRHQHADWPKWMEFMKRAVGTGNNGALNEPIKQLKNNRSELPTALDLREASSALETLVRYYDLEPRDLASGILPGHSQPSTALSALDCVALGKFYMLKHEEQKAHVWFNIAMAQYPKEQSPKHEVFHFDQKRIEELREMSRPSMQEQCNFGSRRQSNLHCRYNNYTTPFLRIAPLKMEEISMDPVMMVYHDAIYESEIEWFLRNSKKFKLALVLGSFLSPFRTAKNMFFDRTDGVVVETIQQRIADMSGLLSDSSDQLSMINYGLGGHYKAHYDTFDQDVRTGPLGNRMATVLFYLGNVELGGHTTFPKLKLMVEPKRRSAVIWFNLEHDGKLNMNSNHGACPVLLGSKY